MSEPKKAKTIREQTSGQIARPKSRRVRKTVGKAAAPLKAIGRLLRGIFRPFSFLLWPFKTKVGRFIGRVLATVLLLRYFRDSFKELKNVTWPNRRETVQLTFAVFMFALFFGLLVAFVDYGLDKLFRKVILKI